MGQRVMGVILDTDILIDIKRGHPNAIGWLNNAEVAEYAITAITAMEIVAGSRNKSELRINQAFLNNFRIMWPETEDFQRAFDLLVLHRLSNGIGIADCLIAAIAIRTQSRLYTFNQKHLGAIPEILPVQPYTRS